MGDRSITDVFEYLSNSSNAVFLLDGGTGEELFAKGIPDDRKFWSATAIIHETYHATLKEVHRSFLDAGADAITTNSYGIIPGVGFNSDQVSKFCDVAGRLGREAVDEYMQATSSKKFVLGSLGPLVESYRADKIMEHHEGVQFYLTMATAMTSYVDAFLAETLSSTKEAIQVIDAICRLNKNNKNNHPLLISFTVDDAGNLRGGENAAQAIQCVLAAESAKNIRIVAFLFNCSEPESISLALEKLHNDEATKSILLKKRITLGAYANRLTPVPPEWTMESSEGPQPFRSDLDPCHYHTSFVSKWVKFFNVKIIGGCCAMTPDHISYLSKEFTHN
jgi:S-methylmethionine-dependent homocysteine/selenocysteine methylase